MAPKRQAKLRVKGKSQHSVQPVLPLLSPCSESSASSTLGGTKCRKKKGSSLLPTSPSSGLGKISRREALQTSIPSSLPSTSSVVLPLQTAAGDSCSEVGPSLLEATASLSDDEGMEQEEVQKEIFGETIHPLQTCNQSRMTAAEVTSEVEPIELDESACEVVDLTCEPSESLIVDLTHNDSVVCIEEDRQWQNQELRSQLLSDSCILSSDDESEPRESNLHVTSKLPRELLRDGIASSVRSGTVNCPICMEGYSEIVHSGRLIVSTTCGHIFCSQCLRDALRNANCCPACRRKLNHKQYHPIYI
ncbi:E3 ubiquitin-protein ligase RNF4-like [Hemicordylus capensis]|uniref:E3 ubiquitin-protein ligase RNF4-like n=1 Tax=Hemicordylus capensis TaxID=884348 RepID=UPI002304A548|nr:E3 ubiquitin-protein ligase RNF4-like [Hemicordylus capensis]XP_053123987.1 E3 ubiquitin-protein ligase RNF4-like [Hemicordylus capensis]